MRHKSHKKMASKVERTSGSSSLCSDRPVWPPYLRRGVGAALWRLADRRVEVLHPVFDSGSFVHFYVGDGEDALTVGA